MHLIRINFNGKTKSYFHTSAEHITEMIKNDLKKYSVNENTYFITYPNDNLQIVQYKEHIPFEEFYEKKIMPTALSSSDILDRIKGFKQPIIFRRTNDESIVFESDF